MKITDAGLKDMQSFHAASTALDTALGIFPFKSAIRSAPIYGKILYVLAAVITLSLFSASLFLLSLELAVSAIISAAFLGLVYYIFILLPALKASPYWNKNHKWGQNMLEFRYQVFKYLTLTDPQFSTLHIHGIMFMTLDALKSGAATYGSSVTKLDHIYWAAVALILWWYVERLGISSPSLVIAWVGVVATIYAGFAILRMNSATRAGLTKTFLQRFEKEHPERISAEGLS